MAVGFWNPDEADSLTTDAREGESHPAPPVRIEGEGAITGDPPDHYVHLANGAVIPGSSGGTHYDHPTLGLIPIVRVFPAGRALVDN